MELTKKQAKSALTTLTKVECLFGPKGENWITGDFQSTRYDDKDIENTHEILTYCLIGACRKADGHGERFLIDLLAETVNPSLDLDEIDTEDAVIEFNDNLYGDGGWKEIKGLLKKARKKLEKRIAV